MILKTHQKLEDISQAPSSHSAFPHTPRTSLVLQGASTGAMQSLQVRTREVQEDPVFPTGC